MVFLIDVKEVPLKLLGLPLTRGGKAYLRGVINCICDNRDWGCVLRIRYDNLRSTPTQPFSLWCELDPPYLAGPMLKVYGHNLHLFVIPAFAGYSDSSAVEGSSGCEVV